MHYLIKSWLTSVMFTSRRNLKMSPFILFWRSIFSHMSQFWKEFYPIFITYTLLSQLKWGTSLNVRPNVKAAADGDSGSDINNMLQFHYACKTVLMLTHRQLVRPYGDSHIIGWYCKHTLYCADVLFHLVLWVLFHLVLWIISNIKISCTLGAHDWSFDRVLTR